MRATDRLIGFVTRRSRAVAAVFLVVTLLLGSGVEAIEQSLSVDQFQTDSDEANKQAYIDELFGGDENTTTAQLIVREGNALSKGSLISTLELQGEFRGNETINTTLVEEPFGDLSNVVTTAVIRQERADKLEIRSEDLETWGETLEERSERLEAKGEELAERGGALEDAAAFSPLIDDVADAQAELDALEAQYRAGGITEEEYEDRSAEPAAEIEGAYDAIEGDMLAPASTDLADRGEALEEDAAALEERSEALETEGEALENDFEALSEIDPSREEQIAQLDSMSQSEIDDVLDMVLDEDAPREIFLLGGQAARRVLWAVVAVVLLLTAGSAYGAAGIDTAFEQEDFIADDPPAWMQSLPEPLVAGEYDSKANLEYVNANFLREDTRTEVLVEGDVTCDDALERLAETDVRSPLSVIEVVAEKGDAFEEAFSSADTTGDGVPDENVEDVYDALFAANAETAEDALYRTETGEYESFRFVISIRDSAGTDLATEEKRAVAAVLDGDGLETTATGQLIVFGIVEE